MRVSDVELILIHEIRDKRDDRVAALESSVADLNNWRPEVDGYIDYFRLEMQCLSKRWDREVIASAPSRPAILSLPKSVAARPPASSLPDWPKGTASR